MFLSDPQNLRINHDPNKDKCDPQCIGGCSGTVPTHLECYACTHVMDEMSDGKKNCKDACPEPLLKVLGQLFYSKIFDFSLIYFNLNSTTTGDASRSRTATIERFCTTPRRLIRNARTRISRDNAWPIAHRNMKKCKR